ECGLRHPPESRSALVRDEVAFPVGTRLPRGRRAPRRLERADAAVPAQDGVVVPGRLKPLGLGVTGERLVEERTDRTERQARGKLRLRLPLAREAAVEGALVGIAEPREDLLCLAEADGCRRLELIGQRQAEDAVRQLVAGVDREDVATDALGLRRLV